MSERQTDYRGSAELNLDMVHNGTVRGAAGAQVVATTAQAYATLALVEAQQKANEIAERAVEQQRIANVIALSAPQKLIGGGEAAVPSWDAQYQLRPEIAEALGLS